MIEWFNFLWNAYFSLTGWQMILWAMYFLYFVGRIWWYFCSAQEYGVINGYKQVMFGHGKALRLYHLLLIIWDLPMAIIGLFLPILKRTLTFKIYEFRQDKPEDKSQKKEH